MEGLTPRHRAQETYPKSAPRKDNNSMSTPTSPPEQNQPRYQPPPPEGQPPAPGPPFSPAAEEINSTEAGGVQAERRAGTYRDAEGNLIERQHEVWEDPYQRQANLRYALTTLVSLLFGVLEVILLLRFLFRLLGANPNNSFISFLYGVSHPFVAPFNGIFNDQTLGSQGVFEASTLIAFLIYGLLVWLIAWLVKAALLPRPTSSAQRMNTRRRWR